MADGGISSMDEEATVRVEEVEEVEESRMLLIRDE